MNNLKRIWFISIFLFGFHAIEEYFAGFYQSDALFISLAAHFKYPGKQIFIISEVLFVTLLSVGYFLLRKNKMPFIFKIVLGLFYPFELTHLTASLGAGSYVPGLITSFLLLIIGFFYWKELMILLKSRLY